MTAARSGEAFVRTVLGDVPAADLGVTDSHDHLFLASPLLPGQELDDAQAATAEAKAFAANGGRTIVQWTPLGLGRRRSALASIATLTGLHLVGATGRHRAEHYPPGRDVETTARLADAFVVDLTTEFAPCGLIKVGTGYRRLDAFECTSLDAAAIAHTQTGAPIAVHLESGTAGDVVLARLGDRGVAPESVVLGHIGRNPDDGYLDELAAAGAFLCFDGPSRAHHQTDWRTPECIEALVEHGHLGRLLVGGDTTTAAARSVDSGPGAPGLLTGFGHRLRRRLGEASWNAITVENPSRALALRGARLDSRAEP